MSAVERTSKFLSYVLRHKPDSIGLTLDPGGWADVDELIARAAAATPGSPPLTRELLLQAVAESDKRRFSLSPDGQRVRANQGHSFPVDLDLTPSVPPEFLYHGTATRFVDAIRAQGLLPMSRQHVHLSRDEPTATTVGQRHGRPAVLRIRAASLHATAHPFYLSANQVWLTPHVPADFIDFPA